jgi:2,5-dihydroxypyridine 5,6-dioxygenase
MLRERVEGKWIQMFVDTFQLCRIQRGDVVAVLSETQSRQVNVQLAELALKQIGASAFHIVLPSPELSSSIPVRSTGTSLAVGGIKPVIAALSGSAVVIDCTVEGLLHAPELRELLSGGARVFMISNEHPEVLERCKPDPMLKKAVELAKEKLARATWMRVKSKAGTDLRVHVKGAPVRGAAGFVDTPGQVAYWPAGLCLCFPLAGSVNGVVVLAEGDVNLTFKRYFEKPVQLRIEDDKVVGIEGNGLDFDLLRSYYAAWADPQAYGVSHVGWGLNPNARWDSLVMYDRTQINGTELRAFAGNFLFSTGSNDFAGRFTEGHFDFPMRNCSIFLDDEMIVSEGVLVAP